LLSHFPYFGDGEGSRDTPERYSQYRLPDMGEWLIHGHVHDPIRLRGKSIHVGVDAWNLAPVHLDEIVKLIESQELSQSA
jgi:calcineurin-like phosphoesterase family protein